MEVVVESDIDVDLELVVEGVAEVVVGTDIELVVDGVIKGVADNL